MIIYLKKKKESLTVLCSFGKHTGSSQSTREVKGETRADRRIKLQLTEMHNKLKSKETNKNKNTTYVRNYSVKKERKTPIPQNTLFSRETIKYNGVLTIRIKLDHWIMQFKTFYSLTHYGNYTIIYKYRKCTRQLKIKREVKVSLNKQCRPEKIASHRN